MARVLKNKELVNTRLAANYGGWMYCTECGENIGYLCYQTYDSLDFNYECKCGSCGSAVIDFDDSKSGTECEKELITIKNRLCCPDDNEPLITLLDKKLAHYDLKITCKSCGNSYRKIK
ncbi:MAG: hypothetical protein K2H13_01165 [Eubacterium sp.]|nr:hypothetical protein [Eubacterium sp.]